MLLEPLSVSTVKATSKLKSLLCFDSDLDFLIEGRLPGRGVVETIAKHPFFVLGTNSSTKKQRFDNHEVMERPNVDVSTTYSSRALHESF